MRDKFINLDKNASWGVNLEIVEELNSILSSLLNPSSIHQGGQKARYLIEKSRDAVKTFLKSTDINVIFTSGATESNNTALFMPFWSYLKTQPSSNSIVPELITTTVEHPAVLEVAKKLSALGVKVHYVSPRKDARFYLEDFISLVNTNTKLLSIMAVNNENGAILPVKEVSLEVKKINPKILVHSDAVQLPGKLNLGFDDLSADMISISAHKVGGLTGVGALVVKKGLEIDPLIVGGPQETRRRAGTENVLGIISFGLALENLSRQVDSYIEQNKYNCRTLKNLIKMYYPQVQFLFEDIDNVGNTISAYFPKVLNTDLVVALDLKNIYVSSGSACSSGKSLASSALMAFGKDAEVTNQTIRISLGGNYTQDELEYCARSIAECAHNIAKN